MSKRNIKNVTNRLKGMQPQRIFFATFESRIDSTLCVTCHRIQYFAVRKNQSTISLFYLYAQFNQLQALSHTLLQVYKAVVDNDISLITNYIVNYVNGRFDNLRKSLN